MELEEVKKLAWWAVAYVEKVKEADAAAIVNKKLTDNFIEYCTGKSKTLKVNPTSKRVEKQNKFNELYEKYNLKKDRKRSEQRFMRLSMKDISEIERTLPDFLEATSLDDKGGKDFKPRRPLFSVYISGRRWEDETKKKKDENKKFQYSI